VSGGRRRSLVRDKAVAVGHDAADLAQAKAKRAADRLRGAVATGDLSGVTHRPPETDQQLHDRIRARLGRVISHPKAVQVTVDRGCVYLRGDVLTREVDPLLAEVGGMVGVTDVRNELQAHDTAQGISQLQGRGDGREPSAAAADSTQHTRSMSHGIT
jgi:osmotically-inducible protein OsmY